MKKTTLFVIGVLFGAAGVYTMIAKGTLPILSSNTNLALSDYYGTSSSPEWIDVSEDLHDKMGTLMEIIEREYYDIEDVDIDDMKQNALRGFVDALHDPYSLYLSPQETEVFDEDMEGSKNFEGIGAVVAKKEDGVLIEEVLKDSPAFNAGLKPLDIILRVNGELVDTLTLADAVNMIRGPEGTDVVLTVVRGGDIPMIEDVTVTRGVINLPSVSAELFEIDGKNIVYVDVRIFAHDTIQTLLMALREFPIREGVILDLRGNGGGFLPTAVELSSFFLPENELVVTTKYRTLEDEYYFSEGYADLQGLPVVILVDGLTASSSEIVAAALRDHESGFLIGTTTFGKGSIQTILEDNDGSGIKLTIGKWYTPTGENVDEIGLLPDREVEFDMELYETEKRDNQLEAAKEEISRILRE